MTGNIAATLGGVSMMMVVMSAVAAAMGVMMMMIVVAVMMALPFPLPLSYWSQCCGALCWLDSSGQGLPSPDVTDGLSRQHADRWPSLRAPPRVHALE
ncbi:GTPase KRas [Sarotherodon galilaeus]